MKNDNPSRQFWTVLASVNVLAMIYPINLLHHAETADDSLFAAFALIGFVFLLMVLDAVSVVIAEVVVGNKY